jgi:uncharacterized protein (UPF0305 family)
MHKFQPKLIDKTKCMICDRDIMPHILPICEACSSKDDVDVYGKMLLCKDCRDKETAIVRSNDIIIADVQVKKQAEVLKPDYSIPVNGDIWNAETVSIVDLKKQIDENVAIENKVEALHQQVMKRIETYKTEVLELDAKKFELVNKQQALIRYLRDEGNKIKNDIRERLKQADINHPINHAVLAVKVVKPKVTALDRIVQAYMLLHEGSNENEVRQLIRNGMKEKGLNPDV